MEDNSSVVLRSIGLSKNEVKVYLDLIGNNFSTALEISRRTDIHRSNTYDSLKSLAEKGFVREQVKGKKKVFQAMEPLKLHDYMEQKEHEIDSIIPKLKQLSSTGEGEDNISLSGGLFALKSSLNELLETREEIDVYGISEEYTKVLGDGFLKEFHRKQAAKDISVREICSREAYSRLLDARKNSETRYLSGEHVFNETVFICGDRVLIIIFSENLFVIDILNKEIADSYRKYFEVLWSRSKTSVY